GGAGDGQSGRRMGQRDATVRGSARPAPGARAWVASFPGGAVAGGAVRGGSAGEDAGGGSVPGAGDPAEGGCAGVAGGVGSDGGPARVGEGAFGVAGRDEPQPGGV